MELARIGIAACDSTLAALLPSVLNLWQGGKTHLELLAIHNSRLLLQICFDQWPHAVSAVPTQSHHQTLLLDLLTDLMQLERPTQHAAVPSTCLQQCYGKQHPPSQTCKSLPAAKRRNNPSSLRGFAWFLGASKNNIFSSSAIARPSEDCTFRSACVFRGHFQGRKEGTGKSTLSSPMQLHECFHGIQRCMRFLRNNLQQNFQLFLQRLQSWVAFQQH